MSRTIIKEFGSRGSRRCLVIRETSGRYLVERFVAGKPKRKRYADKASALAWARVESEWVFYGKAGKPYTYGAYWSALGKAEKKAKVKHEKWRAAHGFRRTAVTTIRQETGDAALALLWVNHRNLRDAAAYVKGREDEFAEIADGRNP